MTVTKPIFWIRAHFMRIRFQVYIFQCGSGYRIQAMWVFYKSVVHRKDSLKLIIWRFCLFFVSLPGSPRIRIWNTEINHAFAYFWGRNQIISFPSQSFVRFSWQPSDCNINKLLIMSTGTGILLMVNYIKMGCNFFFIGLHDMAPKFLYEN